MDDMSQQSLTSWQDINVELKDIEKFEHGLTR